MSIMILVFHCDGISNCDGTQVAVTLTNGHKVTTSFAGGSESDQPDHDLSRSLSSLSFSETSLKNLKNTSLPLDGSSMPPTPTFPTPQSRPPLNASRLTPLSPDSGGISGSLRVPLNFESPGSPRLPLGKPPALPPKTPTAAVQPPPRPASKELRLDDILRWRKSQTLSSLTSSSSKPCLDTDLHHASMCAEYERQIEAEQREVRESMALSPPSRPATCETTALSPTARPESTSRPVAPPLPETPQKDSDGGLSPSSPSATLQVCSPNIY